MLPSKMRTEDGYQRGFASVNAVELGDSKSVQPSPFDAAHGSKMRIAGLPSTAAGWMPGMSPPTLIYVGHYPGVTRERCEQGLHTIEPLLIKTPDAQNEFETTFSARTELVSRSQSAPHAEWPLICSGSSLAP
jgi:hypothetical protein